MNAYLFTGVITQSQLGRRMQRYAEVSEIKVWDSCASMIVFGATMDDARQKFEAWAHIQPEGENPIDVVIRKISAGQFVNQLFAESGSAPLDWPAIVLQAQTLLSSMPVDDFEQGYWVDVEQAVPLSPLSSGIEDLQRDLPEDISSGLNWSADKQFLFLVSILTPPFPQQELEELPDEAAKAEAAELREMLATFPQVADRQAAVLVQARNSAVAAWLWRRYAADKQLAALPIRIDPWCGVLDLPPSDTSSR